jgi:hypothetical protein
MPAVTPPRPALIRCPKCNQPLRLAETVWDMNPPRFIRIYECKCGVLVWDD